MFHRLTKRGGWRLRVQRAWVAALVLGGLATLPLAWAKQEGAAKWHSGSPDSYAQFGLGGNCTDCHVYRNGTGSVELIGAPQRYRAGETYDLTVRVYDPEMTQIGAGFEVSAENPAGHQGSLLLSDTDNTQYADSDPDYITHTLDAYIASVNQWAANGSSFEYEFQWQAPSSDVGPVTLFAGGNAGNDDHGLDYDHFYATHMTMPFGVAGDADGDGDFDLFDFAWVQQCFSGGGIATGPGCQFADFDGSGQVDSQDASAFFLNELDGPIGMSRTSGFPPGYVAADLVRGGLLFDRWWRVNGAPAPTDSNTEGGSHPLYPSGIGAQSGSNTFRCRECHGWDYKGKDGAYGPGSSHETGIGGIFGTKLGPQAMFNLLKADPDLVPNGHHMGYYGMSDADIWDAVKMCREGTIDTAQYILPGPTPFFLSFDLTAGRAGYETYCASCHDDPNSSSVHGTWPWSGEGSTNSLDQITRRNPWQMLHTIRFGHPGSPMPSLELLGYNTQAQLTSLGAFCTAECLLGTDNCDVNAACTDHPTGYTCECNPGYVGDGVTCVPE